MSGIPDDTLLDHLLGLASGRRLLYVPTGAMEDPARTIWWYEDGERPLETSLLR